MAGRVPLGMAL